MGRVKNVTTNAIYGIVNNLLTTVLSFATRTVFIYTLGANYLGLNGLFTNVLGLLSLADLGISSAITYSLYKPLAEHDDHKILQIIHLFGLSYKIIGIIILILGLLLLPFLRFIVNFPEDININYHLIYVLFLINSVSGYLFFSYKNTIIYADQKTYLTTKYEMIFSIISFFLQIVILLIFKNYYLYLIVPIIINILKNYTISLLAIKLFPVLQERCNESLPAQERKKIFKNIYSIALLKFSGVIYSSTDNLIISIFINTVASGIYSNYIMIINIIKGFLNIFFNSITASVGNLNAVESSDFKLTIFNRLNFMNSCMYGYCFTCLYSFLNPFITLWIGEQYTFSEMTVFLLVLTFLVPGMNNIINIYKDACGLFWETRFRTLITALINIISSIILVQFLGINGILLGTIIAYLTTIYIVDPILVYKKIFKKNVLTYYFQLFKNCVFLLIVNLIVLSYTKHLSYSNITVLVLIFLVTSFVYLIATVIVYHRNEQFKYYFTLLKNYVSTHLGA